MAFCLECSSSIALLTLLQNFRGCGGQGLGSRTRAYIYIYIHIRTSIHMYIYICIMYIYMDGTPLGEPTFVYIMRRTDRKVPLGFGGIEFNTVGLISILEVQGLQGRGRGLNSTHRLEFNLPPGTKNQDCHNAFLGILVLGSWFQGGGLNSSTQDGIQPP